MDSRTFDVASRIFAAQLTKYSRPAEVMDQGTDSLIYGSIRAARKFIDVHDRIVLAERLHAKVSKTRPKVAKAKGTENAA